MGDQRVDQRAGFVARGRMHHEASGLVDDDDVVVLIDDIERDILAHRLGGGRFRHIDCDRIAGSDMISGIANGGVLDGGAVDRNLAGEDQRLQPRPGKFGKVFGQHAVEPARSLVAGDDDFQPLPPIWTAICALFQG